MALWSSWWKETCISQPYEGPKGGGEFAIPLAFSANYLFFWLIDIINIDNIDNHQLKTLTPTNSISSPFSLILIPTISNAYSKNMIFYRLTNQELSLGPWLMATLVQVWAPMISFPGCKNKEGWWGAAASNTPTFVSASGELNTWLFVAGEN